MSFPRYPEYKDSGVEWLGQVPTRWEVLPLKFGYQILGGSTPSAAEENWGGDIVWVTPADLSRLSGFEICDSKRRITQTGLDSCGASLVPAGSIILSTRAPIGSLGVAGKRLSTNQGCKSLVPMRAVEPRFHAYLLSIATEALNVRGKGTTFVELSRDELAAFSVSFPSKEEQTAIVSFLDNETASIDALIAEQQRLIELLKEKRHAVISHAVTKGLDPDVPMKDSGVEWLGEVPSHWEVRKLSSVTNKITNGYVGPTRGLFVDEGIPYLQSLHIKNNKIKFSPEYFVPKEWSDRHEKSVLVSGDVLIVQTGDIGQVAVVPEGFPEANCHALIIASTIRDVLSGWFLSWVLDSDYGFHSLMSIKTGALHPHLNCGYVKDIYIPVPPLKEQEAVVARVEKDQERFESLIAEARQMIGLLKERRSALISAAVTGKIDVRGWRAGSHDADVELPMVAEPGADYSAKEARA